MWFWILAGLVWAGLLVVLWSALYLASEADDHVERLRALEKYALEENRETPYIREKLERRGRG
ncbi:MAG TPA: hypothetical protein VLA34_12190 [Candidatus Krumholzibacterium sp.]|nr:hypothetical protein [Candidatus Krumholzibacterium sp.]